MIVTEVGELMPLNAKIVINTCSLMLKGPGLIENVHFVPGTLIDFTGRVAAINFPNGRMRTWIESAEILTWF